MKYIEGDLITLAKDGKFDIIVHGCNCFCKMGSGIAKCIKKEWPEVYVTDLKTKNGDRAKLGTISTTKIGNLIIVNAYIQFTYWEKNPLDYNALGEAFLKIKKEFSGKRIGYPLIGCGLAGGNWNKVETIIDIFLGGEDYTLVYLSEEELKKAKKICY